MAAICTTRIDSPKAWRGSDMLKDRSWELRLDETDIAELEQALVVAKRRNVPFPEITREDFPLDRLAAKMRTVCEEVYSGRGFVVVRGVPVRAHDDADVKLMLWGLGRYIGGRPLQQGLRGEYLTNVRDRGDQYGKINVRGNGTNAHLPFHTDKADIICLMCLRKAVSGGLSSIVSSVTVHNEIVANHPEYLGLLYSGFHYILRDHALEAKGYTEKPIPVFSWRDGKLSSRYLRNQINAGAVKRQEPFTSVQKAALDYFDELTHRPDLHLAMDLQEGDIQVCNNYTILHSRTGFVDGPEPHQKRHMLRLWHKFPEPLTWPLDEEFPEFNGYIPDLTQPQRVEF